MRSLSQERRCQGAADECEQTGDMETGKGHHFQHQGGSEGENRRNPTLSGLPLRACLCPAGALKGAYPPRKEGVWAPQGA